MNANHGLPARKDWLLKNLGAYGEQMVIRLTELMACEWMIPLMNLALFNWAILKQACSRCYRKIHTLRYAQTHTHTHGGTN